MKPHLLALLGVSLVLIVTGCDQKEPSGNSTTKSATRSDSAPTPAATPVRQTSFQAVTSQLDPDGSIYGYLATDQWLAGLSTNIARLKQLVLSMPEASGEERANIERVFDLFAGAAARSGLEDLTGVGFSGVQIAPDLYRTKLVLHHHKGQGDGLLWNLMGKAPHPLTGLDLLPKNTALAAFGDIDLPELWQAIESGIKRSELTELIEGLEKFPAEFEKGTKMSWAQFLASLGGEVGFILTLDDVNLIGLPLGANGLEVPTPGLMLAVKVNNDLLFDRISSEMKKNTAVEISEVDGLKICAMPIPVPLPMDLKITAASSGDYFFLATSPALVQEVVAVRAGQQPGLRKSPEFAALLKHLPAEGNQFVYADKRFSATIQELQKQVLGMQKNANRAQMEIIEQLLMPQGPTFGLSISGHTETGWHSVSVGNQDSATTLVAAPAVFLTAMGGAIMLPAFSKAKTKAQSIACMNNMKQVNLALLLWSADHEEKFPFNVSLNRGGTLEICERGGDGYDRSAYRHFQVLSNELITPKLLVCPSDSSKQEAPDFTNLQSWHVSYQLRTGAKVSSANPQEIVIYCPVHHHVGRTDGSVQQGSGKK